MSSATLRKVSCQGSQRQYEWYKALSRAGELVRFSFCIGDRILTPSWWLEPRCLPRMLVLVLCSLLVSLLAGICLCRPVETGSRLFSERRQVTYVCWRCCCAGAVVLVVVAAEPAAGVLEEVVVVVALQLTRQYAFKIYV